jgi:hypothetical protein
MKPDSNEKLRWISRSTAAYMNINISVLSPPMPPAIHHIS